jgi:hypothetical protein
MRRIVPYRLGDIYGPPSVEQEVSDLQQMQTQMQKALAAGSGGSGIGLIVVLAVAGLFLLSHTGRRR